MRWNVRLSRRKKTRNNMDEFKRVPRMFEKINGRYRKKARIVIPRNNIGFLNSIHT